MKNLAVQWWQRLTTHKERPAYTHCASFEEPSTQTFTYAQWGKHLQRLSVGLMERGLEAKKRVGFVAGSATGWIDLCVATWFAGACVVTCPEGTRRAVLRSLARSGCDWIVVADAAQLAHLQGTQNQLPPHLKWIVLDPRGVASSEHVMTLKEVEEAGAYRMRRGGDKWLGPRMYERAPEGVAWIAFSQAHGEDPHGATFNDAQIARQLEHIAQAASWEDARVFVGAHFGDSTASLLALSALWTGQQLILGDELPATLDALAKLESTHALLPQDILMAHVAAWQAHIQQAPEFLRDATSHASEPQGLSGFFGRLGAGAARSALLEPVFDVWGRALKVLYMPQGHTPEALEDITDRLQVEVLGLLGCAETGITHMQRPGYAKPSGVGRPVEGVACKLKGTKGDEPGEILVKGQDVMMGYWDKEGPMQPDEHGWLHLGVEGHLQTGFLRLLDPEKGSS